MTHALASLQADIAASLDYVRTVALRTREVMLDPCKPLKPADFVPPPANLGGSELPDQLPSLHGALLEAGQPTRHLAAVLQAQADLSAVFRQCEAGAFAGTTVGTFRAAVEKTYGLVAQAVDDADSWLTTWPAEAVVPTAPSGPRKSQLPNLDLLDKQTVLSTEDLAEVLGVVVEVASRHMRQGDYGAVTKVGRRNYVRSEAVRAALRGGEEAQR